MFLGKGVLRIWSKFTGNTHAEVWFQWSCCTIPLLWVCSIIWGDLFVGVLMEWCKWLSVRLSMKLLMKSGFSILEFFLEAGFGIGFRAMLVMNLWIYGRSNRITIDVFWDKLIRLMPMKHGSIILLVVSLPFNEI